MTLNLNNMTPYTQKVLYFQAKIRPMMRYMFMLGLVQDMQTCITEMNNLLLTKCLHTQTDQLSRFRQMTHRLVSRASFLIWGTENVFHAYPQEGYGFRRCSSRTLSTLQRTLRKESCVSRPKSPDSQETTNSRDILEYIACCLLTPCQLSYFNLLLLSRNKLLTPYFNFCVFQGLCKNVG